jgi:hypothetical protein
MHKPVSMTAEQVRKVQDTIAARGDVWMPEHEIAGTGQACWAVLVGNSDPRAVTCPTQAKGDEVVSWIVPRKRR